METIDKIGNLTFLLEQNKNCKIYIYQTEDNQRFIVKMTVHTGKKGINFCTSQCKDLKNEYYISQKLKGNPGFVNYHCILENQQIQIQDEKFQCCYTLMDFANKQDFLEFNFNKIDLNLQGILQKPQGFRFMFLKITKALYQMHKQNIVHSDIKLDNLFLHYCKQSEDLFPKIGDYGMSYEGSRNFDEIYHLYKNKRTEFCSPEIIKFLEYVHNLKKEIEKNNKLEKNQGYKYITEVQKLQILEEFQINEKKIDVYNLGLAMFEGYTGVQIDIDKNYKNIKQQILQSWIDKQQINKLRNLYQESFKKVDKNLEKGIWNNTGRLIFKTILGCMNSNPSQRITLEQVIYQLSKI